MFCLSTEYCDYNNYITLEGFLIHACKYIPIQRIGSATYVTRYRNNETRISL